LSQTEIKFFPSRYPIVEALMNHASDLRLAVAVAEAGAFPSLWLPETADEADACLTEFAKLTGHCNVIVPILPWQHNKDVDNFFIENLDIMRVFRKHRVSHIEVLRLDNDGMDNDTIYKRAQFNKVCRVTKSLLPTVKLIMRIFDTVDDVSGIDAYAIKGKESAGKTGNWAVKDLFVKKIQSGTQKHLIPYGGIGTPEQVGDYIKQGATAVAVGTLFAASLESPLSAEVKTKMINAGSVNLDCSNQHFQNQLILDQENKIDNDDWNRSQQLKQSMTGAGDRGFIYAGRSIDHVNSVIPVKDIVEHLVSQLPKSDIK
jgi:NAD(P)H-dependent flavin oxidoreductase YrpB (nitropropane dioxygenase family)